ncbi:putative uncharacterized protein [Clostridium sp. CAG:967]|nr:putative uncharacterized protein [Clostridium sp. CAG:967]
MKKAALFYITLFLLILAFTITADYFDYDLWARLIAGMGVIDGGHVLKADFLSYTPVHTWWDHEWGSGVIFYFFLKYFGPYSLLLLQSVLFFGIFFIASKIIKLRSEISPYNILFYFFAVMAVMHNFNSPVRCHMFSFLLFTLYIYIFELARKGKNKPLFLIPIITILWNNIHGGVVAGLGLTGMYALGEFLNNKPFKKYLITLVISALTLFINPWGYEYIKFLLMANTMERTHIVEWWGLFSKFHLFKQIPFKVFMLGSAAVEFICIFKSIKLEGIKQWYKNADKVKYIVLLSTLYLALSHVKLLPFFAIASVCFVYEDFYKLIKNINLPHWKDKAVYILLIAVSLFTLSAKEISLPAGLKHYPVKEVEFVKINNLKGKILVNFGLGSYVSYKLYPDNLIFMDGRYEEVYYDYMVPMLKEFCLAYPHWKEILQYFPPDIIIIENYYPVYNVLKESSDWHLVYTGGIFGVFVPKNKSTQKFKMPTDDINYYKNTLFNTGINFK